MFTAKKTPYEIVFGQHPRSSIAMFEELATKEIVNEEDLPIEILDTLDESSNFGGCLLHISFHIHVDTYKM
jgi:hypothetical protein